MPTHISRACSALNLTHNTLVPFLYQTRTLTAPLHYYPLPKSITLRVQSLSSTSKTYDPEKQNTENDDHPQDPHDSRIDTSSPDSPSQHAPKPRKSYLQRRASPVSQQPSRQQPIRQPALKPHSMTRGEKKIFGDLLEQLGAHEKTTTESARVGPQKPSLSEEDRNEMSHISAIFDSVLDDIRRKKQRSEARSDNLKNRESAYELDGDMSTWQDLETRDKHHGLDYSDSDFSELHLSSTERAIQLTVQRESMKIETALRTAIEEGKGDMGIWDICKERIFSMLQYLGDSRATATQSFGVDQLTEDRVGKTDVSKHPLPEDGTKPPSFSPSTHPLAVPASVPIEPVVTALYPKMLLVAFRLLNSHFPDSPLISQFRSTIKSHGRTSAVLGSSTGLYNELIYFYWRGCNDLPGVVSLLQEMEVTGVEPDSRTCGLLKAIMDQRERDLKHHRRRMRKENQGSLRDPWWDMAPNRKAAHELFGPDGWVHRLEARVKEIGERREYST